MLADLAAAALFAITGLSSITFADTIDKVFLVSK